MAKSKEKEETAKTLKEKLNAQREEIKANGYSESALEITRNAITKAASFPIVSVDREKFLRKTFGNSKYIDKIIADGPQSVYKIESLRKKADDVIKNSTRKTATASFLAGIPSNPVAMVALGAADVTQFFAFALNMAQKIAYIFGEDQIFSDKEDLVSKNGESLPEDVQVRMIALLGGMMGVNGAAGLIIQSSKKAGQVIGKKVAQQALTKTVWFPVFKKVGSYLGYKVTRKSVEKIITKSVPVIGGAISGGITFVTFKPMGRRLADIFVRYLNGDYDLDMELNPEFLASLSEEIDDDFDEDVIDAEVREVVERNDRQDYEWIVENLSDVAPKSYSAYMRMKNANSANYQKIVELATEEGYVL